jgi:hypothetical protein
MKPGTSRECAETLVVGHGQFVTAQAINTA